MYIELPILTPSDAYTANGVSIKKYFLTEHNANKISLPSLMQGAPVGVTIHNTDDINEAKGTTDPEQYTRATLNVDKNGNSRLGTVRVHFYVDDDEAWQCLPLNYQSWHCGQKGKAETSKAAIGNDRTISIECIMDGKGGDKDKHAEDNCARLAAYILDKYGLTIDNLYTHNYWCNVRNGKTGTVDELNTLYDGYKGCPRFIRPHWADFRSKVLGYMSKTPKPTQSTSQYYVVKQYGAYGDKQNAERVLDLLKSTDPKGYYKIMKVVK